MEESGLDLPSQTPLFYAQHSDRYRRQGHLRQFEAEYEYRLVVVAGRSMTSAYRCLRML
jgi:hypothetical protein